MFLFVLILTEEVLQGHSFVGAAACHLDVIYIGSIENAGISCTISEQSNNRFRQDIVLDATKTVLRLGASVYIQVIRLQRGCAEGKMM